MPRMKRGSGILLAISSLPDGSASERWEKAHANLWIGSSKADSLLADSAYPPTGFGDSVSGVQRLAGNQHFIDLEDLHREGLLPRGALDLCESLFAGAPDSVDYYAQYLGRPQVLQLAFRHGAGRLAAGLEAFRKRHQSWLRDYALYMALKGEYEMKPFDQWPDALSLRDPAALKDAAARLKEQIDYHIFVQYIFYRQWDALRKYAGNKGIRIIGDMPIYMAPDSADAWVGRDILDREGRVAGCPPDYFSATGQLWGNPLYDWEKLKETGYEWWMRRITHQLSLYDDLRIDHFRGFEAYWAIPCRREDRRIGSVASRSASTFSAA